MGKSFGRWFAEQAPAIESTSQEVLPDGLTRKSDGKVYAMCRACEKDYEWDIDPSEGFDQDMSYCGGSPNCCP